MSAPIPVLINRSGTAAASLGRELRPAVEGAFAATGRAIALDLIDGGEIADAVARHAGAPVIVVGGGDGTLSTAASTLAHSRSAMGILPLGTHNYLAGQLGVPLDLAAAARLIASGERRRMDLGAAGGRIFVSSASFGIYTRLLRSSAARGGGRWLKAVPAAWHVLRNLRTQLFGVRIGAGADPFATPLLFVGNHFHHGHRGDILAGEGPSDGELAVFAVSARSRRQQASFAARAMLGFADADRDFGECGMAREIVIEGSSPIDALLDGEPALFALPLTIGVLPGALGVVVPREAVPLPRELSRTRTPG